MSDLRAVKGTRDLLPPVSRDFSRVIERITALARVYCYDDMFLPIFEYTDIFKRTLGNSSDIVNKEMYTFDDKKGRSLTLRPEFTAGVVRSIITNGLQQTLPLRLFTVGQLFRYENPQKCRYRQFNQANFEIIGVADPSADAEMIELARNILSTLGIEDTILNINSLGDKKTREEYNAVLKEYFVKYRSDLSEDSKVRLEKNPLRIFDSKDSKDQEIAKDAPVISSYLSDESKKFFDDLLKYLSAMGISYTVNPRLVRGLDYYTHTVFEFITNKLGAQGTVIAGGRYDNLFAQMGGNDIPAVGFAGGIERLMELSTLPTTLPRKVMLLVLDDQHLGQALSITSKLRAQGIPVDIEQSNKINKSMKRALEENFKFIVFLGESEIKTGTYKLKNLDKRIEEVLSETQLIKELKQYEF